MAQGTRPAGTIVAEVLATKPGATVAELAEAAGLGQSSVGKALAALEAEGAAIRAPGGREGGRRLADRWTLVTAADAPPAPAEDSATAGSASDATTDAALPTKRGRLGKGALGSLVLAHLSAHPDEDYGPVAVAKALGGKSSGAEGNALQRLCDAGDAVLVSESPRRYQIAGTANGAQGTDGAHCEKTTTA
jgi:DNA-binding transcriptional ArsR family regulator